MHKYEPSFNNRVIWKYSLIYSDSGTRAIHYCSTEKMHSSYTPNDVLMSFNTNDKLR